MWTKEGGAIIVRKFGRAACTGKVGMLGASTVDRVVCHTCRREKEIFRWKTHRKERLLSTDDDEREKR
jgi:hypothetical protein